MTTTVCDLPTKLRAWVAVLVACAAAACGSVKNPSADAGVFTDAATDASTTDAPATDAGTDASTGPDAGPARAAEVVNGSARVRSGTYTLDVQVGNTFSPTRSNGATYRVDVNPAVSP